eukprot:scaffold24155_cov89-Cyclotella_meneghiniana.AAC.1
MTPNPWCQQQNGSSTPASNKSNGSIQNIKASPDCIILQAWTHKQDQKNQAPHHPFCCGGNSFTKHPKPACGPPKQSNKSSKSEVVRPEKMTDNALMEEEEKLKVSITDLVGDVDMETELWQGGPDERRISTDFKASLSRSTLLGKLGSLEISDDDDSVDGELKSSSKEAHNIIMASQPQPQDPPLQENSPTKQPTETMKVQRGSFTNTNESNVRRSLIADATYAFVGHRSSMMLMPTVLEDDNDATERQDHAPDPHDGSDVGMDFTFRRSSLPPQQKDGRVSNLVNTLSSLHRSHHPRVLDHYSLPTPSSTVRFRCANVHVYDSQGSQLIMEERLTTRNPSQKIASLQLQGVGQVKNTTSNITVKRVLSSSPEELFLRVLYAAITFFMGSFLFIFAVGLLLFLISDLANQARDIIVYGTREKGTILSTPVFMKGLTQLMTLVTSFVVDTFSGSPLLHSFGYGRVMTNWIKFIFFIGIPAIALAALLFTSSTEVLALTLETTFISITIFFVCFSVVVVFLRLSACLYLVQELYCDQDDMTAFEKLKYVLLTAEEAALSGKKHNIYIYFSDLYNLKQCDSKSTTESGENGKPYMYSEYGQWYIKFTQLLPRLFITLDSPRRCWTQEEIDFNVPFYTSHSWSLESMFCRQKKSSRITIVSGQSAVTLPQSISSMACYMFGILIYILLVAGSILYFQAPSWLVATVICILVAYWSWKGRKELGLQKSINLILRSLKQANSVDEHDLALFQKWETYTVTKPTPTFTWVCFFTKNFVIAIIPFAYFCYAENVVGAMVYLMLFALCFEKSYLDIGSIGAFLTAFYSTRANNRSFGVIWDAGNGRVNTCPWWSDGCQDKGRVATKIKAVPHYSYEQCFKPKNLGVTAAIASGSGQEEGVTPYTTFPSNNTFFYDEAQNDMSQICRADFSDIEDSSSNVPMKADSIQPVLDTWFGEGEAILDQDVIPSFRKAHPELPSSASFQLVTFSDGSAVVCVRGTKTYHDFLVDARLWYAAKSGNYTKVEITGHSLGGGLALITGAQTETRAIGISAPSSTMTRSAVTPEISLEDIKQYSVTLVPQRDIISHLGGRHDNSNQITCRASIKDSFSCHLAFRSLCELLYTCGSKVKRPVYCECLSFGYPEPKSSDESETSLEASCQNL